MSHQNPKEIIALAAGGFKDMSRESQNQAQECGEIFLSKIEKICSKVLQIF